MTSKIPFVPISCNARTLTLFDHLSDAGLMLFCLLCASQNAYRGLEPGEFFFSKVAMAKRLHVSRRTLSDALHRLTDAGYLTIRCTNFGSIICITEWQAWHNGDTPPFAESSMGSDSEPTNPYAPNFSTAWAQIEQGDVCAVTTTNKYKVCHKQPQTTPNNIASVSTPSGIEFDQLWLAHLGFRSWEEIAEMMHMHIRTVYKVHGRALQRVDTIINADEF